MNPSPELLDYARLRMLEGLIGGGLAFVLWLVLSAPSRARQAKRWLQRRRRG